jgi:hypothetical protein
MLFAGHEAFFNGVRIPAYSLIKFAPNAKSAQLVNMWDLSQNVAFSQFQPRNPSSRGVPLHCKSGIECPVHGEIKLPDEVYPILRTKPFKRLRKLKQLGVCSLVRALPTECIAIVLGGR